jgi:phospholipid transport system substrate-binding protein
MRSIITKNKFLWLAGMGLLLCAWMLAPVSAAQSPDAMLQERSKEIMVELKKDGVRADINQLYDLVDRMIVPLIDFKAMSKLTLGKHWKKASAAQRSAFMDAYQNLLRNTYTKSLKNYANQDIRFFPQRTQMKGKYVTVFSEFVPGGGKANVPINYKLRKVGDEWKAYNLEIEGLSLVKNYRTSFGKEISATGLDSLIARLNKAR